MQPGNPFAAAPAAPAPNPFATAPAAPAASPFPAPGAFPATPQGMAAGAEEFGMAPTGEATGPRIRDYGIGRLVLVMPKFIERVKNTLSQDPNAMQDRITADIVALNGDAIPWGGAPEKMPAVPHDKILPVGTLVEDFYIGQVALVRALKKYLPPARPFRMLAHIAVSEKSKPGQNPAWLFDSTKITDADKALANAWIARYNAGTVGAAPTA